MHAYARANGPEVSSNGVPVSGGRGTNRADTPQVFSSRQAVVDGARLPLPVSKPTRFGSVNHHQMTRSHSGTNHSPPQPHGASPPMRRARTNSNDRVGGGGPATLWAPSVLSDSEFNSPTSELDPNRNGRLQPPKEEMHQALAPPPAWNPHQSSHFSEFIIGNDGMMKVRPIPNDQQQQPQQQPQQHHLHHISNHIPENPFESPPLESQGPPQQQQHNKLPVREALGRGSYAGHPVNQLIDEDEMMGAVPSSFENPRRVPDRPRHEPSNRASPIFSDEDEYERIEAANQITPRAKDKKPPRKLLESSLPPYTTTRDDRGRKRRRNSCDYDDNALSSMKFSELRKQPFDYDPSAETPPPLSRGLEGDSLTGKLEYYKKKPEADQKTFFTQMSVTDWERSGDWFLEQFGSLIQQMKENRQQRRAVVDKYEREIANREESVRLKTESIHKKLDKMKQNGLRVVADGED